MLFKTLKKQHGNTDDVSATDPKLVVVTGSEPNDDTHTASETYPIASELPSTSFSHGGGLYQYQSHRRSHYCNR